VEAVVGTVEERVAFVEGRVGEHARMIDGIRQAIVSLEHRMDQRFSAVDQRFTSIDQRFADMDRRFTDMDRRLTVLDEKLSRQFLWLVGIQMSTFGATIATLLTRS
jgi:hypothetical protein